MITRRAPTPRSREAAAPYKYRKGIRVLLEEFTARAYVRLVSPAFVSGTTRHWWKCWARDHTFCASLHKLRSRKHACTRCLILDLEIVHNIRHASRLRSINTSMSWRCGNCHSMFKMTPCLADFRPQACPNC
jgi:hypothetical protein